MAVAGDGGAASFWRRHPFKGVFEDLEVEVAAEGSHVVTVETSANAAGSCGQDSLLLSFYSAEETYFGGTNFVANIYIATNLTNTVADTIQYYHGDGEPTEEDSWLAETAAASLVFTGRLDEVDIEVGIGGFGGLTTNVDSFAAEMCYNISTTYQPVYSNTFVETSATSGLFRSASVIAVGRGDLTVEVRPLDGSLPGTCVPVVERVKGPADLLESGDCTLSFMGEEYELEAEDGWFYPQGGSPRYWVVVPNQADPSTVNIITYEPVASVLAQYGVLDWKLESLLGWQARPLFGVKVRVLKVDSVELVGAPSDGLVVKNGDDVTMEAKILPTSYVPPANEPRWYYQRLKTDGSWEAWTSFGTSAHGKTYTHTATMSGVIRVKTVLTVSGSVLCEKTYERTANEAYGYGKAGDPGAFGVTDTQIQIDIRDAAKGFLGSTAYPYGGVVTAQYGFPEYPAKTYKCNIFVAHRAEQAGADVPAINGIPARYPPLANEWAGTEDTHPLIPGFQTNIDHWTLLTTSYPQPGFIVGHPNASGPGHVGIVDYDGHGIGAGVSGTVNKKYPAFLDGTSGFRRYDP